LKRYHAWLDTSALQYEQSVVASLAQHRLPVAEPIPAQDGATIVECTGARWGLYPALTGEQVTLREWMWRAPQAASTLATMHGALERFEPDGVAYPAWDAWSLQRVDEMLGSWPALPELPDELLGAVRDHLAERFFDGTWDALPKTIVHGEFTASNLLWRGDQLVGVLDFEKAHRDTPLCDLAMSVGSRHPPLIRAVLATYTRVRPLSPLERESLPEALLLSALADLHTHLIVYANYDEAARRAVELAYLMRGLDVVRKASAH
jgi:Ser/Thr protein kinase RdoA (MazF antagonist)